MAENRYEYDNLPDIFEAGMINGVTFCSINWLADAKKTAQEHLTRAVFVNAALI